MPISNLKVGVQSFGRFLSGMVMPNIGAFIAWGFITALFIPSGWIPNEQLAGLVDPMITYLLPLLIGYTGGKMVAGDRGAVAGAITTMGVIVGSSIPMFLGAMIVGPLGGYLIKQFDAYVQGRVKSGFEMLVNNFSLGIVGMLAAIVAFYAIGPIVTILNQLLSTGVSWIVDQGLLPLLSVIVEPAKVLFLNNAINHGIFTPLGAEQVADVGKSIFYLVESNPGPGLGILLAYMVAGKGMAQKSAYGASVIHFFGGIHEIYFPYILMKPLLIIAAIAGGMAGVATNVFFGNALAGPPSPGSIVALVLLSSNFTGILLTIASVAVATAFSFAIAFVMLKADKNQEEGDFSEAQATVAASKVESRGVASSMQADVVATNDDVAFSYRTVKKIVVACDAGMGSSAMGASVLRNKVKARGLAIEISNSAINDLSEADIVITQVELTPRAQQKLANTHHLSISNFMDGNFYDQLLDKIA